MKHAVRGHSPIWIYIVNTFKNLLLMITEVNAFMHLGQGNSNLVQMKPWGHK